MHRGDKIGKWKLRKEKGESQEEREEDKQWDEALSRVRINLFQYKIPLLKKLTRVWPQQNILF